jgi:hypothetical protein
VSARSDMQQQPSGMQQQQQPEHQQKMAQASSNFITTFAAGGAAGMLAALITCPVEVVKTKLQVSYTLPYSLITSSRLNPHHTRLRLRIRRFLCTASINQCRSPGTWRSKRRQIYYPSHDASMPLMVSAGSSEGYVHYYRAPSELFFILNLYASFAPLFDSSVSLRSDRSSARLCPRAPFILQHTRKQKHHLAAVMEILGLRCT